VKDKVVVNGTDFFSFSVCDWLTVVGEAAASEPSEVNTALDKTTDSKVATGMFV
jgi:hypothetical protein